MRTADRLFLRVGDLGGAQFERRHPDIIEALVVHVLYRDADVATRVVMVDVTNGLETRGQPTQFSSLGGLRVSPLEATEDPL